MNLLLYSLGLIYAKIISKEPIINLKYVVDTSVKPNKAQKKQYISSKGFPEPISDKDILDLIYRNVNSKFGTEQDEDGDGKSNFAPLKKPKKKPPKKKPANKTDKKSDKKDKKSEDTKAKEGDSSKKKEDDKDSSKKKEAEDTSKKKEGEGSSEKKASGGEALKKKSSDSGNSEAKKDVDSSQKTLDKGESKSTADSGKTEEKTESKDGKEDSKTKEDEGNNTQKKTENKDDKNSTKDSETTKKNKEKTTSKTEHKSELRGLFGLFSKEPEEQKITPNHPESEIEQSVEVDQHGNVIWDPDEIALMKKLSEVDYENLKSDKEIKESEADEVEMEYTSTPREEGQEEIIKIKITDNIYDDKYKDVREELDLHGFKTKDFSVPPNFFSDEFVQRKFCRMYPKFELCHGPSMFEIIWDYVKAIFSSMILIIYLSVFAFLCFFFFFRLKSYYMELSNAISNGYMEFYEKQNPIMVITKLERQKLENIKLEIYNAKKSKKKKGFFAKLFSRKKKEEDEKKEEEKPLGEPKTTIETINTFDGRQFEVNNKNLTPVLISFDIIDKKFQDMSNYIQDDIEQDIIYYEIEIEMLLGSTDIFLGN